MLFIFFCQLKETKTGNFTLEFVENFQVYDLANIGMRQPREKLNAKMDTAFKVIDKIRNVYGIAKRRIISNLVLTKKVILATLFNRASSKDKNHHNH